MRRSLAVVLTVLAILVMALATAGAQSGVPEDLARYRTWTRMNTLPLIDPSNPRAGPKNTFINLSPGQLREVVGPGGRARRPFPEETIIVRESLDPAGGFLTVLFVMRKQAKAAATKGWGFSGFSRRAADQPFQPVSLAPSPFVRCLACHGQMQASDFVFTPFANRPDLLPARTPAGPDRVEIFNYQFGPQTLRIKPGATVVWANYDLVPHDVKAADRSFESGNLPLFDRYFLTFAKPGTYEYFCAVHLQMRGRVVVED